MKRISIKILLPAIVLFSIIFLMPVLSGATQRLVIMEMQTNTS